MAFFHPRFASPIARRAHRRWWLLLVTALALALAVPAFASAASYEQVSALPNVTGFASARLDLLSTIEVGELSQVAFGKGAVILPDRTSIWIGTNASKQLIYVVQIGTTIYINDGSGWQKTSSMPTGELQSLSIVEQLAKLQQHATAILKVGEEPVRGQAATHYQLWLTGASLLELNGSNVPDASDVRKLVESSTYKYDLWIGDADGLLYQQNTVVITPDSQISGVDVPGGSFSTLMTFYDFNDPSISIQPPI